MNLNTVLFQSLLQVVFISNTIDLCNYVINDFKNSKNQCKKTYQFITQCKGVICHPFKTAKIIVFDAMKYKSPNVPLQDELLHVT